MACPLNPWFCINFLPLFHHSFCSSFLVSFPPSFLFNLFYISIVHSSLLWILLFATSISTFWPFFLLSFSLFSICQSCLWSFFYFTSRFFLLCLSVLALYLSSDLGWCFLSLLTSLLVFHGLYLNPEHHRHFFNKFIKNWCNLHLKVIKDKEEFLK